MSAETSTGLFDPGTVFSDGMPRRFDEAVGQRSEVVDVAQAAAHEALDRDDGVLRVDRLGCWRVVADFGRCRRRR